MSDDSAFQHAAGQTTKRRGRPGWLTLPDAAIALAISRNIREPFDLAAPPSEIRDALFEALSTGEVRALVDNGEIHRALTDLDCDRLEFQFNFTDSSVRLFHGPGGEFDCIVHKRQLLSFASVLRTSRKNISPAEQERIVQRIVAYINSSHFHSKAATIEHIVTTTDGVNEYRARKLFDKAAVQANRPNISAPGRKKKRPD